MREQRNLTSRTMARKLKTAALSSFSICMCRSSTNCDCSIHPYSRQENVKLVPAISASRNTDAYKHVCSSLHDSEFLFERSYLKPIATDVVLEEEPWAS